MTTDKPKGFAALPVDRRREIARLGGKSIPASKRFFAISQVGASLAGQKGGKATPPATRNDLAYLDKLAAGAFIVTDKSAKRTRAMAARLLKLGLIELVRQRDFETVYTVSDAGYAALRARSA
jgi:general stress protein YciG